MKRKLICALAALVSAAGCLSLFSGCSAQTAYTLAEDEDGNKYYIVSCTGYKSSLSGSLTIPAYYGEGESYAPVREIAQQGFSGTYITSVTIPATVTKIGNAAFSFCEKLKEVNFAEDSGLEEISRGAFGYCTALKSVSLPYGLKRIEMLAFMYCEALGGIALPEGLETIGLKAFYYSGLEQIIIPDSVRDIVVPDLDENGEQKTDDNGNPLTLTTPAIGIAAFHSCTKLELAVIGKGVTSVSAGAFGSCLSLAEVYLPASLERVEGAHYADGSEERPFTEGTFYCGHAFHNDAALTDIYYGGTAEQWTALSANIENTEVTVSGYTYNNGALLEALHHFGAEYVK